MLVITGEAPTADRPSKGPLDKPSYNASKFAFEWSVRIERPSRRRQLVVARDGRNASRFVAGEPEPPQDLMRRRWPTASCEVMPVFETEA